MENKHNITLDEIRDMIKNVKTIDVTRMAKKIEKSIQKEDDSLKKDNSSEEQEL